MINSRNRTSSQMKKVLRMILPVTRRVVTTRLILVVIIQGIKFIKSRESKRSWKGRLIVSYITRSLIRSWSSKNFSSKK